MTKVTTALPDGVELGQQAEERITGITGTVLTLDNAPIPGAIMLFRNFTLMDPPPGGADYTIQGKTITLAVAAVAGDVYLARYIFRSTTL